MLLFYCILVNKWFNKKIEIFFEYLLKVTEDVHMIYKNLVHRSFLKQF